MTEQETREIVRHSYQHRCGYCGVHEEEAGSLLELDHFQPRSAGGGDEVANLVYCCPTCNRRKGDFWPSSSSLSTHRLLHPQRDDLPTHFHEQIDGWVVALTEIGAFHIERLQLNRPPLVALRRTRLEVALLQQGLRAAQNEQVRLQQRIKSLTQTLEEVLDQLAQLSSS
jgi:hypothetical protein